uniref:Replication initiator protein n=1 Tax=Dulem virus 134 TaxID=3145611 RepID=A0AAU8AVW2_9VIRU
MSCSHPLKAFPVGLYPSGKTKYKICSYDINHVEILENGSVVPCTVPDRGGYCKRYIKDFVEIPCGKCMSCRLAYSREWANRCLLELEYHKSAYFVTITYDDWHVPRTYYGNPNTGEALPSMTLCKRDIQLFFKRLRKKFPDQHIRYFGCGEYGPSTMRPHYHFIIFGLDLNDLKVYSKSSQGYNYFTSKSLEECWSFPVRSQNGTKQGLYDSPYISTPAGYIVVGEVTWETCAYTARYMTKKLNGPEAQFYEDFNLVPPCSFMSRKPGIGRYYYDDHPDLFKHEYINVSTPTGGRKFRPPKYFDRLFDLDEPELSSELKVTRKKMAEASKAAKLAQTDLDYLSYLQVEENSLLDRIKSLKRSVF